MSSPTPAFLRKIPSTGEALPALGLGTWKTFDVPDGKARDPLAEVLERFAHAGGRLADTSPMYGEAEDALGSLARRLGLTDRLFLASKVWTQGREEGILQMENTLALLGRKRLDLMQVHNLVDWEEHVPVLKEWKAAGRIRYWGLTHYRDDAQEALEKVAAEQKPDFLQCNYSVANRAAERRLLSFAAERGMAVIVNRPFGEGALFRKVHDRPLPDWAEAAGLGTWSQFFLAYALSHPAVTCVIPATSNPEHQAENLGVLGARLPDEAMRRRMAACADGW